MGNLYRRDLASIHHQGFGDFARRAAPALLQALREAGLAGGRVVDLGCGSGIWLEALGRAGYQAVGVDPSPAMLRLARRNAPRARLVRASAHDLEWPTCQAVTALGEVLSYRQPSGRQPSLPRLFRRVARALEPGGLFVFELLVAESGPPMTYRNWRAGRRWAVLIEVSEDLAARRLQRNITTFWRVGAHYRRTHEEHALQIHRRADIERALRAAGFVVRVSGRYGDLALAPRRLSFWARKPAR